MKITVTAKSIDNLHHECLVFGFFSNERPPKGYCGFVDWRLNNLISLLIARSKISGNLMEKVMISPNGRLPASKILLLGLGKAGDLTYKKLFKAGHAISQALHGIQCSDFALDIPGIGRCKLETSKMALAVAEGCFDFCASRTGSDEESFSLCILGKDEHFDEIVLGMHEFKVNMKSKTNVHIAEIKG